LYDYAIWQGEFRRAQGIFIRIILAYVGVVALNIATIWLLGLLAWRWIRRIRFGVSRVEFNCFPFFLGDSFDGKVILQRGLGRFEQIRFRLCCVGERISRDRDGKGTLRSLEEWNESVVFNRPGQSDAPLNVNVCLALPDRPELTTRLPRHP